jgi:hypothetical protein
MTNPPVPENSEPATTRLRLPGVASVFFTVSPFMLLFGGFLGQVNASRTQDWAVFQTQLGSAIFLLAIAFLMTATVLVGVRAIAQQQVDILLKHKQ